MPDNIEKLARTDLAAARGIARALMPAENSIDASLVATAALLGAIVQARLDTNKAGEAGHDAIMSAVQGVAALGTARDHAVTCHRQLADLRDVFNLDPQQTGCTVGGKAARRGDPASLAA